MFKNSLWSLVCWNGRSINRKAVFSYVGNMTIRMIWILWQKRQPILSEVLLSVMLPCLDGSQDVQETKIFSHLSAEKHVLDFARRMGPWRFATSSPRSQMLRTDPSIGLQVRDLMVWIHKYSVLLWVWYLFLDVLCCRWSDNVGRFLVDNWSSPGPQLSQQDEQGPPLADESTPATLPEQLEASAGHESSDQTSKPSDENPHELASLEMFPDEDSQPFPHPTQERFQTYSSQESNPLQRHQAQCFGLSQFRMNNIMNIHVKTQFSSNLQPSNSAILFWGAITRISSFCRTRSPSLGTTNSLPSWKPWSSRLASYLAEDQGSLCSGSL